MNADAAQEDRSAVKQDVRALGFYRAKSDALCDMVRLTANLNFVKPRAFRRPRIQFRTEGDLGAPLGIRLEHLVEPCFGNSNCDLLLKLWPIQLHPALDVSG